MRLLALFAAILLIVCWFHLSSALDLPLPRCLTDLQPLADKYPRDDIPRRCALARETVICLEQSDSTETLKTLLEGAHEFLNEKCAACVSASFAAWMMVIPIVAMIRNLLNF